MGDQRASGMPGPGTGLIVELTGARGVGKSTFAAALRRALASRGCQLAVGQPTSVARRLSRSLHGAVDQLEALRMIVPWRPESLRELRKLVRRYRRVRRDVRWARAIPGVHVFDECVWHMIMTLYIKTHTPDIGTITETVRQRVGLPHIVVLVDAADAVIASRRQARAKRGDLENPLLTGTGREGLDALRVTLAEHAARHPDVTLIVAENGDAEAAAAAAHRIADLVAAASVDGVAASHTALGRDKA